MLAIKSNDKLELLESPLLKHKPPQPASIIGALMTAVVTTMATLQPASREA